MKTLNSQEQSDTSHADYQALDANVYHETTPIVQAQEYDEEAGYQDPSFVDVVDGSFSDASIRNGFIRKVFAILAVQLLTTFGIIALFVFHGGVQEYVLAPERSWLVTSAFVVTLFVILSLSCCPSNARSFPKNYIYLGLFTVGEGILVGYTALNYDKEVVVLAAGMTSWIVCMLAVYAMQTKYDYTGHGPYLYTALWSMILMGFLMSVTGLSVGKVVMSAFGVMLFSFYLVFDIQLIVRGSNSRFQFGVDDYVFAALNVYLDILNIFLYMLRILGDRR